MHSHIIQIDSEDFHRDEYISPNDFDDNTQIDYCYAIKSKSQNEIIENFVQKLLPPGMFEWDGGHVLVYKGGCKEFVTNWVTELKKYISKITADNIFDTLTMHYLNRNIHNALDIDTLFVIPAWSGYELNRSTEFIHFVSTLSPGDKLYIGNVLAYHY